MPAPLSREIREKIIIKYEKGVAPKVIYEELELRNLTSVYNIINRYKSTGSIEPMPLNNGRKPMLDESDLERIRAKIKEKPDVTLDELKTELGLPVCISALCRTINNKLKLPLKKDVVPSDPAARRRGEST